MAGIDDQGRVAGAYDIGQNTRDPLYRGFLADGDDTDFRRLGTLGQYRVWPEAIRDGIVVGAAFNAAGQQHAFRTARNGRTLVDLGTFGGAHSVAYAVNKDGVAVGYAEDAAGVQHAFITEADGSLRQLDAGSAFVSSQAHGVDAEGHVVGAGRLATGESAGFVTGRHGGPTHDLNDLVHVPGYGVLENGVAINARGQILANDFYDEHGPWLLTPAASAWSEIDGL